MKLVEINKINFGFTDGKNEAKESNFKELFFEDGHYIEDVENNNKFIISGRKGTGKTTLAYYLISRDKEVKNHYSKMLFANDFTEKKLLAFASEPVNREEMMTFWKYVFLLEIASMIVENYKRKKLHLNLKKKISVDKLSKIVENENYTIERIVSSQSTEVSANLSNNIPTLGSGIKSDETSHLKKSKYYESINRLEKHIFKYLNKYNEDYYLYYDDMDQLAETMDTQSFVHLLKFMVYSAEKINNEFRELGNTKIRLVLRSDILNLLQESSSNLNKVLSDFGVRISWFNPNILNPIEHPLIQMIVHKIRSSVSEYAQFTIEELYDEIFKDNKNILDFFMSRGLGRPRDIVQFFNILKERYPNRKYINFDDLVKCEADYSHWFYNEFLNEIKIEEEKENILNLLALVSHRGRPTFTFKQIEKLNDNNSMNIYLTNLTKTLEKMRELSMIGTFVNHKKIEFSHRENITIRISEETKFLIHRGLRKYMNL